MLHAVMLIVVKMCAIILSTKRLNVTMLIVVMPKVMAPLVDGENMES